MRRLVTLSISLAVGAGATLAAGGVASASTPSAPAVVGHGVILAGAGKAAPAAPAPEQSAVAGYFTPVLAGNQKVTGTIKVPIVTCGAQKSADYLVVGLGSTTSGAFLGGLVQITCTHGGDPTYQVAAFTGSSVVSPKLTVAPRDVLMIVVTGGTNPVATIKDKTTNKSVTGSTAAFTANTGQFSAQAAGASFPGFARVGFSSVNSSGKGLNVKTATRYDQYNGGQAVLLTSAISKGTFNVTPE